MKSYIYSFQTLKFYEEFLENELIFNESSNELPMKDFHYIESMIEELENKDAYPLTFSANEREEAMEFFKFNNYYNFVYYRKLLPPREDAPYSFTECLALYKFDNFIRENLNKFTGVIEMMFRATLVQQLCSYYEGNLHKGEFYLDYDIYNNDKIAFNVLKAFSDRMSHSKSESAIHHINKKNKSIPFWVIVEEATFGELFHFTTTLKPEYLNAWVENSFNKRYRKHITSWIRAANFMRNNCAHYSRIYGRFFSASPPKLLKDDRLKAGIKATENKTLFANMLAFKNIIQFNSSAVSDWNIFLEDLENRMNKDKIIKRSRMGFPENWNECLTIPLIEKQNKVIGFI